MTCPYKPAMCGGTKPQTVLSLKNLSTNIAIIPGTFYFNLQSVCYYTFTFDNSTLNKNYTY